MKLRLLTHVLQLATVGFFLAVFAGPLLAADGYTVISTADLEQMLEDHPKPHLIYSLSEIEFMEARIPGSICIPMEKMERSDQMPPDRRATLVFYCLGPG